MPSPASATSAYAEFSALLKRKAFAEAVQFAERQVSASHDKSEFWFTHLALALRLTGKVDEALVAAEKACALAPANPWALIARAEALADTGNLRGALQGFEEAIHDQRVETRAQQGALFCLSRLHDWDRMLSLSAQWAMPPAAARHCRARALAGLGRSNEAMEECRLWLAESPDNPQALRLLTGLQVAVEGLEAVRARLGRLSRIPGKPPIYAELYASLCTRSGDLKSAADEYEKLAHRHPSALLARKQAFALAKAGGEAKAVPLMEELLRMAPADRYLHAAYLPACRRLNDLERAWKFYHELIALHPEEKTLFGRLKRVQKMLEAEHSPSGKPGKPDL